MPARQWHNRFEDPALASQGLDERFAGIRLSQCGGGADAHRRESAEHDNLGVRVLRGKYGHFVVLRGRSK